MAQVESDPPPSRSPIADDSIADRIGHLAGIWVDALELALLGPQQEFVLVADPSLGCVAVPETVLLRVQKVCVAVPSIE